jgi:hypothetical protein
MRSSLLDMLVSVKFGLQMVRGLGAPHVNASAKTSRSIFPSELDKFILHFITHPPTTIHHPLHNARSVYIQNLAQISSKVRSFSAASRRAVPRNYRQHVGRSSKRQEAGEQECLSPGKEEATALCKSAIFFLHRTTIRQY